LNSKESKPENRELYFIVTDSSGKETDRATSEKSSLPRTNQLKLIEPEEEVAAERKFNIKRAYDLKEPGTYKIQAVYQNVYGQEIGLDAYKGKVVSNKIEIKILEVKK